jgi:hypothetical protein
MATTPKRARTSKPDLQEWDLVVLMKDAQFSGSTWCAPELGMVVLVDALDHQVTITWRDVDSVDQAAKTLTRKTGDRCFGVKRIGRASRDGVAEQASVAAALELCRSELRDEVAALLREQAGSEELVGKLARIDERLRLEAAQELFALMSKEGALPVDNDSGRASRGRVAAADTVAKLPATRDDCRGTGSRSDGGGHLRDSRAKRLVEAFCTLSKKADGSVAVGLSLQPAAATAAKKQRIHHDDPEELLCSQTHAQSMAPSTAAATLPTTAIAKHKLAAKAPSKQPSPRVGGLSGDDDAECKTPLVTAVCRPLCVPGGSVKVRLVLSLATAPPLKKQRIARGAQPFEELMPQAEPKQARTSKMRVHADADSSEHSVKLLASLAEYLENCGGSAEMINGWYTKTHFRKEGATAGTPDSYFFTPQVSGSAAPSCAQPCRSVLSAHPPHPAPTYTGQSLSLSRRGRALFQPGGRRQPRQQQQRGQVQGCRGGYPSLCARRHPLSCRGSGGDACREAG